MHDAAIKQEQQPHGHIEVADFCLSYDTIDGAVEAVTDADIHVAPGEFVSIVGPSGCGKSTLAERRRGLSEAHPGTVTLDGEAIDGPSGADGSRCAAHAC